MNKLTFVRPLVRAILEEAEAYPWQYQGFGMLRLYPDGHKTRLNVWMPSLAKQNVSLIHDHAWNFTSLIVSGVLINQRYEEVEIGHHYHNWAKLVPGPEGGLLGEVGKVLLVPTQTETYVAGQTYSQKLWEIHKTLPKEGTVTINERIVPKGQKDEATVYWPEGQEWVDAKPRPASPTEIGMMKVAALRWWEVT